jgi:hypothetical protein
LIGQSPNWFDRLINSVLKAKGPLCPEIFSCYTAGCGGGRELRLLLFKAAEDELGKPLGNEYPLEQFKKLERCRSADWFKSHFYYKNFCRSYLDRETVHFSLSNDFSQRWKESQTAANEKWDQMYAEGTIITAPARLEQVRASLRERVAALFCEGLENSRYLERSTDFDSHWPFNVGSRLTDHIYETFKKSHNREYAHELMLPYPHLYQKMCRMEQGSPWRPKTYRAA